MGNQEVPFRQPLLAGVNRETKWATSILGFQLDVNPFDLKRLTKGCWKPNCNVQNYQGALIAPPFKPHLPRPTFGSNPPWAQAPPHPRDPLWVHPPWALGSPERQFGGSLFDLLGGERCRGLVGFFRPPQKYGLAWELK